MNFFNMKRIIVSGGFDPIHIGHVRMITECSKLAEYVIVVINNDNWLNKKKGFAFMPQIERKEILESIKGVNEVILTNHEPNDEDRSVCETLKLIKNKYPSDHIIFANGGDRGANNIPEYVFCEQNKIELVFNVGGEKIQSSSDLTKKVKKP